MSELNEIFSKVNNEDKTGSYRIKTEWEEGFFRLFVVEGATSWFALVTKEHIAMLAEQHELDPDVYFGNLREYICNSNNESLSFSIAKKQFIIFRSIKKEKFRIKYFFVNLEKLNYQETVESFVDDLMKKCTTAQAKLKMLEEQNLEVESKKMLYEKKCEEFIELKRKSDIKMYSAFALALNEKKHRIRFLTEVLDEYQTGGKQKFNMLVSKKQTKIKPSTSSTIINKPKTVEAISESESEGTDGSGYNTDDEKKTKAVEDDGAVPGTSKDNLDFLGDDSPPPPSLPKRSKRAKSETCLINSPLKDLKQKMQANGSKEEAMDVQEANSDDDSQSLDFNSQDILDRL